MLKFIDAGRQGNSTQLTTAAPAATSRLRLGFVEHRLDSEITSRPLYVSTFARGSLRSAQLSRRGAPVMFW
jgi:hypothetical protein